MSGILGRRSPLPPDTGTSVGTGETVPRVTARQGPERRVDVPSTTAEETLVIADGPDRSR
jgi:hypothetical protein